ncbi:MAG: alpha/beta hydrolase [Candidatus Paceibacterota bacterium]|jgi:DNA-binding beta-propeller fold protein YncE/pimeloyl-ACP methyl ester carboxylesterase
MKKLLLLLSLLLILPQVSIAQVVGERSDYPVGLYPLTVAFDNVTNSVWVVNMVDSTVSKVDIANGTRVDFPVVAGLGGIAFDNVTNSIWTTNHMSNTVSKVNIYSGAKVDYAVGSFPVEVVFDSVTKSIWVSNLHDRTLSKVNIYNGTRIDYATGQISVALAFDNITNSLWAANYESNTVSKVDVNNGVILGEFPVGVGPDGIVFDNVTNSVWVTNASSHSGGSNANTFARSLSKVNIYTGAKVDYDLGTYTGGIGNIAFDNVTKSVWIGSSMYNTVYKIDIYTGENIGTYATGQTPFSLAFDNITNSIWVANINANTVSKISIGVSPVTPPIPGGTPPVPTCTTNCNSNIMFLPGVMGSRLYDGLGNQLWVSMSDSAQSNLALDSNGKDNNPFYPVHTKDDTHNNGELDETGIVDDTYNLNIYQSFVDNLKEWKNNEKIIEDYSFIPYDWRLSLDDIITNGATSTCNTIYDSPTYTSPDPSGPHDDLCYTKQQPFSESYILKQLEELQKTSHTKKVTIVAHSNGGLVAKALIEKLKLDGNPLYNQIDKVILIAVPQVGTPDALKALLHGNGLGPWDSVMDPERMRALIHDMPVAYNLLPSREFFSTAVSTPLAIFDSSPYYLNSVLNYGHGVTNYTELEDYLNNIEDRRTPRYDEINYANTLNAKLITDAETTHMLLDAWRPATSTKVIEVAGWGEYTLGGIGYRTEKDCLDSTYVFEGLALVPHCNLYVDKQVLYTHDTLNGDGTVVSPSAHYLSGKNVANVEKWWVDLGEYNIKERLPGFALSHKNIFEVPGLLDLIKSNISNIPSTFDYVSQAQPTSAFAYTRIQLNSPLTLNLYDSAGNHTGLTATGEVEENIPGSRYRTIGESKYILVPKDVATTLRLEGYRGGSFSLNIDTLSGDTITASTTFAAIPSSTSTIVTMDLPANTEIQALGALKVDFNGDGTTDVQLAPKVGEDVLPDATAPVTSVSLSGTLGNNSYYTSDVTVTLSAVDDAISGEISSGVAKTEYSLDGGITWNNYTAPVVVSTEGTMTILYRSMDGLGNQEQAKSETLHIDMTAPTIFASDTSAEQLTTSGTPLVIAVTVEDSIDANPIFYTDVPLTQTFAPGITNILITAHDIAGNIATSSIAVTVYSSPIADPDGDGVPNQDDVKPFDSTVFANLTIPSEYSLWEKESFDLPFSVAGKGNVTVTLSSTYYQAGSSPIKDNMGTIIPATVTVVDGVISIVFSQDTKEPKNYALTIATKKGNTKERKSLKEKRDHELDNERKSELEKELKFARAEITLSILNTTANKSTTAISAVSIYDKQQTAQLQYKYKDTNHSTTLLLKSDDVLRLKKGQPLELTVKVTGIKKNVPFSANISGNFTTLSVIQEEEHDTDNDRKQTKFSVFFPLSAQATQESIIITTTVNGITSTDVVGVRLED